MQERRDAHAITRSTAPAALPYGGVMATAGASMLAGRCDAAALATPLLLWAILQALWIPGHALLRRGLGAGWRHWRRAAPARVHTGMHTVPLGLAVIASGLTAIADSRSAAWVPAAVLAVTCALVAMHFVRFLAAAMASPLRLRALDGTWFLVPAAWLGVAVATNLLAERLGGRAGFALWIGAAGSAAIGWIGYWLIAALAAVRVARLGLSDAPRGPWWIAMGCAGLAAAAIGDVARRTAPAEHAAAWLTAIALVTIGAAILLYVPVLIGSVHFLLRRCRFRARAVWAPTFSTAVFAFGCLAVGRLAALPALVSLGRAAACATLGLWTLTTLWNARVAWRAWRGHDPDRADGA